MHLDVLFARKVVSGIFVPCVKKQKNDAKIFKWYFLFYTWHKKCHFPQNLAWAHRISRCTYEMFFRFFDILKYFLLVVEPYAPKIKGGSSKKQLICCDVIKYHTIILPSTHRSTKWQTYLTNVFKELNLSTTLKTPKWRSTTSHDHNLFILS
jgi:hypothetical protein